MIFPHRPETLTQAYHAGIIVSMLENTYPNEKLPNLAECMVHFHSLRELLGERLWQKIKARSKFRERVLLYEKLTYEPFLPRSIIGGSREFCLGYAFSHKKSKLKRHYDVKRTQDLETILNYINQ